MKTADGRTLTPYEQLASAAAATAESGKFIGNYTAMRMFVGFLAVWYHSNPLTVADALQEHYRTMDTEIAAQLAEELEA